ncbi:hypothetical protein BDV93DRAFT_252956 [Ceratobasidium sp. AG-I]|nr:hypothetical protein BDV93DRAFT_252956 [Ceratobasidium sp. AG-I]
MTLMYRRRSVLFLLCCTLRVLLYSYFVVLLYMAPVVAFRAWICSLSEERRNEYTGPGLQSPPPGWHATTHTNFSQPASLTNHQIASTLHKLSVNPTYESK